MIKSENGWIKLKITYLFMLITNRLKTCMSVLKIEEPFILYDGALLKTKKSKKSKLVFDNYMYSQVEKTLK